MADEKFLQYRISILQGLIEEQRQRIQELEEATATVLEILGPCNHFDHHGCCQTHFVEKPCSVGILREILEKGKAN
jgi:hypothetical protein